MDEEERQLLMEAYERFTLAGKLREFKQAVSRLREVLWSEFKRSIGVAS